MSQACAQWVEALGAFRDGSVDTLAFLRADKLLLEAVAEGWSPSPAMLALAFESLRETLRGLAPHAHHH